MDVDSFVVLVVRGDIFEINDPSTDVIGYRDLSHAEAVDLAEKSVMRGYTVCVWMQDDGEGDGEETECGKA